MEYLILILKISLFASLANMLLNIIDFHIRQDNNIDYCKEFILMGFIPILSFFILVSTIQDMLGIDDDEDDNNDIWGKQF
jgi:hypothetical protein